MVPCSAASPSGPSNPPGIQQFLRNSSGSQQGRISSSITFTFPPVTFRRRAALRWLQIPAEGSCREVIHSERRYDGQWRAYFARPMANRARPQAPAISPTTLRRPRRAPEGAPIYIRACCFAHSQASNFDVTWDDSHGAWEKTANYNAFLNEVWNSPNIDSPH